MFDDDNAARRALQALADEPVPPVATTFDEVLRRGRRRVLAQRVSAVAGVVAVVAAIGVGAILLRPDDQAGGVRVGGTDTTTVPPAPSSQSPTSVPHSTPPTPQIPPGPGWEVAELPPSISPGSVANCDARIVQQTPPPVDKPLEADGKLMSAFEDSVRNVVAIVREDKSMMPGSSSGLMRLYYTVDVAMDNGNGQLQFEAGRYGGGPVAAADAEVAVYGTCDRPYRRVLADGTVLQLYPADDTNPEHPSQPLRIYRPDGRMYVVTSAGYSVEDIVRGHYSTSMTIEGGRGKLPVTAAQLAAIAERLVDTLG